MPGQAGARGAAANQFIDDDRMKVMDGVGLHRCGVFPAKPERRKAAFHFADGKANLFLQPIRAEIAVAHDPLGITPAPAARLGAAGDDEARRRFCSLPLARAREGEGVK